MKLTVSDGNTLTRVYPHRHFDHSPYSTENKSLLARSSPAAEDRSGDQAEDGRGAFDVTRYRCSEVHPADLTSLFERNAIAFKLEDSQLPEMQPCEIIEKRLFQAILSFISLAKIAVDTPKAKYNVKRDNEGFDILQVSIWVAHLLSRYQIGHEVTAATFRFDDKVWPATLGFEYIKNKDTLLPADHETAHSLFGILQSAFVANLDTFCESVAMHIIQCCWQLQSQSMETILRLGPTVAEHFQRILHNIELSLALTH